MVRPVYSNPIIAYDCSRRSCSCSVSLTMKLCNVITAKQTENHVWNLRTFISNTTMTIFLILLFLTFHILSWKKMLDSLCSIRSITSAKISSGKVVSSLVLPLPSNQVWCFWLALYLITSAHLQFLKRWILYFLIS